MGCVPLVDLCLPLADLNHFCLTKQLPKTPRAIYLGSEHSLHFAPIRLCLALLFIKVVILYETFHVTSALTNQ